MSRKTNVSMIVLFVLTVGLWPLPIRPAGGAQTSAALGVSSGKPSFQKVFIVVFENAEAEDVLNQPYFSRLKENGAYLSNFFALTHPSLPNYIAMVSGDTHGVQLDNVKSVDGRTIVDLLEEKGLTWKSYAEDYPGHCFAGSKSPDPGTHYVRRHQPFIVFRNIRENPERCKFIVPASELQRDINQNGLHSFSLFIPNNPDSGHGNRLAQAEHWLKETFSPLIDRENSQFMKDMLFVVTFDEGRAEKFGGGRNHIYTVLYGNSVVPGKVSDKHYNVYNLLKTIEVGLGLGTLTENDKKAEPITGIWR